MTDALVIPEGYTPGPWSIEGSGGEYYGIRHAKGYVAEVCGGYVYSEYTADPDYLEIRNDADRDLLALAPAMAAEIERLRAERDRLREALTEIKTRATASVEAKDESNLYPEMVHVLVVAADALDPTGRCPRVSAADYSAMVAAALSPATGEGS